MKLQETNILVQKVFCFSITIVNNKQQKHENKNEMIL